VAGVEEDGGARLEIGGALSPPVGRPEEASSVSTANGSP
jgi:hypothetical protein